MNPKKVIILGGEGNGSVIASAIIDAKLRGAETWEFAGFANDRVNVGGYIDGFPVIARTYECNKLAAEGYYFINAILRIDGQRERIEMIKRLEISEEQLATFVHPLSYIAPNSHLSNGVVIMPNVCVSPFTRVGCNTLIMTGASVGHDTRIGEFCHLAAQSCIGAKCIVEDGVHIGLNATVREQVKIGRNSTVGMGAVALKDVGENEIWVGNPARYLRQAS